MTWRSSRAIRPRNTEAEVPTLVGTLANLRTQISGDSIVDNMRRRNGGSPRHRIALGRNPAGFIAWLTVTRNSEFTTMFG